MKERILAADERNCEATTVGKSIFAVLMGIIAGVALTLITDLVLHAIHVFPPSDQRVPDSGSLVSGCADAAGFAERLGRWLDLYQAAAGAEFKALMQGTLAD